MRLATKLGLIEGGFAVVVLGSSLLPLTFTQRRQLLDQLQDRQSAEVGQFGHACAVALEEEEEGACLSHLKTLILLSEPGRISYAAFLDAEGRIRVHSDFLRGDLRLKGALPSDPALRRAAQVPAGLRQDALSLQGAVDLLSAPVLRAAAPGPGSEPPGPGSEPPGALRRAGTAAIAFDRAVVGRSLKQAQRDWLARWAEAAVPAVALGLFLAAVLAGALSRPIQALGEGARLIGQGKLTARIPDTRSDELGDLAREFNSMAAKLAELDELKEGFLAQITHDLRNPLAAIASYADVLLMGIQGQLNEKQTRSLKIITTSTQHLNELIGNILDITRMEAGRMELQAGDIDFALLSQSIVDLMRAKADEYEVALDASTVPAGARVWADEAALRRVLVNLVSNALKFTPKGGRVTVALSSADGLDRVAVSDTGIGIPADKLHTLFQKFAQIAETKNKVRAAHGTGLGLVICKQIVEGHGGRIGVESVFQQGATFHFTLPKSPAANPTRSEH